MKSNSAKTLTKQVFLAIFASIERQFHKKWFKVVGPYTYTMKCSFSNGQL